MYVATFKLTSLSKSINLLAPVVRGPIDPGREHIANGVDRAGLPARELRLLFVGAVDWEIARELPLAPARP